MGLFSVMCLVNVVAGAAYLVVGQARGQCRTSSCLHCTNCNTTLLVSM